VRRGEVALLQLTLCTATKAHQLDVYTQLNSAMLTQKILTMESKTPSPAEDDERRDQIRSDQVRVKKPVGAPTTAKASRSHLVHPTCLQPPARHHHSPEAYSFGSEASCSAARLLSVSSIHPCRGAENWVGALRAATRLRGRVRGMRGGAEAKERAVDAQHVRVEG